MEDDFSFSGHTPGVPEANRNVVAAHGYMELDMPAYAWRELEEARDEPGLRPAVAKVEVLLHCREKKWKEALEVSGELCGSEPGEPFGFIHSAYCLHEMGQTDEARRRLADGPKSLRHEPVYFYNLACYDAILGRREDALENLDKAFALDKSLVESARADDDLRSLHGAF